MKKVLRPALAAIALGLVAAAVPAQAQHDHGGMQGMAASPSMSPEAAAKEAREELTRQLTMLQEKIDALDTELERTDLKSAKRKKLETKLQKLLDKKNKLIDDGKGPDAADSGGHGPHHH